MRDFAGTLLDGKYRLVRLIGRGGMGGVYEAEHAAIGRRVAVKLILPELVGRREAEERFRLEARAAGRLYHPNVIEVTDFGVTAVDGVATAYLVMEYASGTSLREVLREKKQLPIPIVVDIVEQIALALRAAHDAGILHRDLKPDNVALIPDARGGYMVKVLDFGIAALLDESAPSRGGQAPSTARDDIPERAIVTLAGGEDGVTEMRDLATAVQASPSPRLTTAGAIVGTPAYMSPEQLRGDSIDARSDVYALALVTFEMLAGRQAFDGSRSEVMLKHLEQAPPPLASFRDVPPAMERVVARSLEKDPALRHATATAFAGSLGAAAEGASSVLRRAIAIYSDRLDVLFPLSWTQLRPLVAFDLLVLTAVLAADAAAPSGPIAVAIFAVLWFTVTTLVLWMTMALHATFAFAMRRMRDQPLAAIDPGAVNDELSARLGLPEASGPVRRFRRLFPLYLRCERKARIGSGDFAFLIAAIENLPPEDAGPRADRLAAPVQNAYAWIRGSLLVSLLLFPAAEAMVAYTILGAMRLPVSSDAAVLVGIGLVPLNIVWMMPVFSIAFSLLYVHARKANGEDVTSSAR
ncbi:MAG TPA: serine/threonine-protein kinase [Thermoanaerobaculia bacterium]